MQRADSSEKTPVKAGGEGVDRGWDGWIALPTQWTWVWANSRRYWRTQKLGILLFMGSQIVRISDWTTTILTQHDQPSSMVCTRVNSGFCSNISYGFRQMYSGIRVPWTARRSNHSILKEINLEYSLKGLMLKLKLQSGHLIQRADSFEKTLMLGMIEDRKRRGWERMR